MLLIGEAETGFLENSFSNAIVDTDEQSAAVRLQLPVMISQIFEDIDSHTLSY